MDPLPTSSGSTTSRMGNGTSSRMVIRRGGKGGNNGSPSKQHRKSSSLSSRLLVSWIWYILLIVFGVWGYVHLSISTIRQATTTTNNIGDNINNMINKIGAPSLMENVPPGRREMDSSSLSSTVSSSVLSFDSTTTTNDDNLPTPSVWSSKKLSSPIDLRPLLTSNETDYATFLCGKLFYSTLHRAVHVRDMGEDVYVATGDIDYQWTRDSAVQLAIYLNHHSDKPWLRLVLEGGIRRNAFYILQDPYGNAYYREWTDPNKLPLKERVIGRGGWVATRNYELDSGAYFLNLLYDYYRADDMYRPEALLQEPIIFEAVNVMVETWIVEQRHDESSPYRYFELPRQGLGSPSVYTGMTWTGFRPSDDACKFHYLVPANMHAAGALERVLVMNERIWKNENLHAKASQLLADITKGINEFGIITDSDGVRTYAYEVDGQGGILAPFDDANVPSLLSAPHLGWSGLDHDVYRATRKKILSKANPYYASGASVRGIGSQHTGRNTVWPM